MYYYHFSRTGGHQGISRTYNRMSRHFWWVGMKEDIHRYNAQCLTCMRRRPHAQSVLKGSLLTGRPGQIVAIDLVGPVEHNQHKYYMLTIIDHFTKFAEAVVLTETTAQTVWQVFYVRWIAIWGCPMYLLSDNGSQFASHEFKQRCADLGIEKIYSTPYHPQGNGVVEAFHQFLVRSVSAYVSQTSWLLVDIVASVLMAYRSTPHPVTGESPYRLMTGLDMVLPHFQQWAEYSVENMESYRRFNLLAQIRRDCFDRVLRVAATKAKEPKGRANQKMEVNGLVVCWLSPHEVAKLLPRFGNLKFVPRWSEPCRILRFVNEEKTVMVVKSIWHRGIVRKVHECDVMPLPKQMTTEALNMAKFEMVADLKRNAINPRHKEALKEAMMKKIPAEDRELAQDLMHLVEETWRATKPSQEGKLPSIVDLHDVDDRLELAQSPKAAVPKRRRIELHALWIHKTSDGPLKGGG